MARSIPFSLSVGKILSESLGAYFRNLVPFVLLSTLILSPWIAAQHVLNRFQAEHFAELTQLTHSSRQDPDRLMDLAMKFMGLNVLSLVTLGLLILVLNGAVTLSVIQGLRGQAATFGESLAIGMRALPRVFLTALFVGLRITLYSLLLLVPGIMQACRLYVAIPVTIMENQSAGQSLERSSRLTDGNRWQIFAIWIVLYVITFVATFAMNILAGVAIHDPQVGAEVSGWVGIGWTVLFAPFAATVVATTYFMLRTGKENVDAGQLAAVFD